MPADSSSFRLARSSRRLAHRTLERSWAAARLVAAGMAALLAGAQGCEAAGGLHVSIAGVAPSDSASVVTYTLTNTSARPYALVRVNCDILDRTGIVVDQASDVTENLAAKTSVQGRAYMNTGEVSAGTTFACHVDQAYR
jgi:hypothetical protein